MSSGPEESSGIGSFMKKGLGFFVELPEDTKQITPTPSASKAAPSTFKTATSAAAYDQEMYAMLQKTIAKRATAYTALQEQANNLAAVIPDRATRMRAAFVTIAAQGARTPDSVMRAIDTHVADVESERRRFKQLSEAQVVEKSGAARNEATRLEQQNQQNQQRVTELTEQIARLNEQTSQNTAKIHDLTHAAETAEHEIRATESRFERTVDYVKNELEAEKSSLNTLLK